MRISDLLIYFIAGGTITTLIVGLEQSSYKTLSGLAALAPVFTLVSYFFIGNSLGGEAVSQHAKWVLTGTLVSWVPYMLTVAYFSPKIGSSQALMAGLGVFLVFALAYIAIARHFGFAS